MRTTFGLLTLLLAASAASAQSNAIPGRDAQLAEIVGLSQQGRIGAFPNGRAGLSSGVTVCNVGVGDINWFAPMNADHPVYAFLLCRESNGRFEQISDRSYVKHGFASINGSFCGGCNTFNGSVLGPNCSDTYGSGLNGDPYWLGPPAEIDPWLGAWDPVGSHFDRGEPDVGPPQNMDGRRSLTNSQVSALGPVRHRVEVDDKDLNTPNARYFYGSYVVIRSEPGDVRENNFVHRETRPSWSGSRWNFADRSSSANGPILQNWTGAKVRGAGNGADDGWFYVGVKVTGPDDRGLWHYEYAIHNRDNNRGAAAFRIPKCPSARIFNASFRDIDDDANNDWTMSTTSTEIAFLAAANNALEWNTIYNVSFDSDAGPATGQALFDQARPGSGAMQVAVEAQFPGIVLTQYVGDGCGAATTPRLSPTGTPPFAVIPNPSFALALDDAAAGANAIVVFSSTPGNLTLGSGCTFWLGLPSAGDVAVVANGSGQATIPLPVPNLPGLEGTDLWVQAAEAAAGGPVFGQFELSNALRVRVGNFLSPCP